MNIPVGQFQNHSMEKKKQVLMHHINNQFKKKIAWPNMDVHITPLDINIIVVNTICRVHKNWYKRTINWM